MWNLFRRLTPHSQTHLVLARRGGVAESLGIDGVELIGVESTQDASRLDAFATANGFPTGWVGAMLEEGASATMAIEREVVLAMAWTTRRAFFVEEIGATLDADGGVYLFGDFVAPSHRGRRLQRLLVAQRLRRAEEAPFACTLVHPSNGASIRSYQAVGFAQVGSFVRTQWIGRDWARCRSSGKGVTVAMENPQTLAVRIAKAK